MFKRSKLKFNILTLIFLFTLGANQTVHAHGDEDAPDNTTHNATSNVFYIHMGDHNFDPTEITIKQGQIIIFENKETERSRWPASNIHPTHEIYSEFDPKAPMEPGQTWAFKFDKPGKWVFHDHLYPELTGTITVLADETHQPTLNTPEPNPTFMQKLKVKLQNIKLSLIKTYFKMFPAKATENLNSKSVFDIAPNEAQLQELLKIHGYRAVMTKLLQESGNGKVRDCHQEAHEIGRTSYELFGKNAFANVSYDCISGYLHGATEGFLRDKGTENLVENINNLCNDFTTEFSKFECLHGSGHGIMAYLDYDLPKTLTECSKLEGTFAQRSCYGGAFMENIIISQDQGLDQGHKTDWVNNDLHYPCNAVDQDIKVQTECYTMQTSRMLYLLGNDFDIVAEECLNAPKNLIATCFKSYGRDVAGSTLQNTQKILSLCQKVPNTDDYYDRCIEGAVNVIIDSFGPNLKTQAQDFCREVPIEKSKSLCYENVERRKQGLVN